MEKRRVMIFNFYCTLLLTRPLGLFLTVCLFFFIEMQLEAPVGITGRQSESRIKPQHFREAIRAPIVTAELVGEKTAEEKRYSRRL